MPHKKTHLDSKICLVCDKPFSWRKKWQDCWTEVKYCSERCRRNKHTAVAIVKNSDIKHA